MNAVAFSGCDLLSPNPAGLSLGLGLAIGQFLRPPLGVATETRRCFQGDRQVPCPTSIPTN